MKVEDLRLCTLCNQLVDVKHPDIETLKQARGNGRLVVRDIKSGVVHVVTTRAMTEKYLEKHL